MKFLLDSCIWGKPADPLRNAGHDVIWAGDWPADPGDGEILARAYEEARVLVTADKDFAELAIVQGAPHHGIVRLVGFAARRQASAILSIISSHGTELRQGAVVTAGPWRVRIRVPPPDLSS